MRRNEKFHLTPVDPCSGFASIRDSPHKSLWVLPIGFRVVRSDENSLIFDNLVGDLSNSFGSLDSKNHGSRS